MPQISAHFTYLITLHLLLLTVARVFELDRRVQHALLLYSKALTSSPSYYAIVQYIHIYAYIYSKALMYVFSGI